MQAQHHGYAVESHLQHECVATTIYGEFQQGMHGTQPNLVTDNASRPRTTNM